MEESGNVLENVEISCLESFGPLTNYQSFHDNQFSILKVKLNLE